MHEAAEVAGREAFVVECAGHGRHASRLKRTIDALVHVPVSHLTLVPAEHQNPAGQRTCAVQFIMHDGSPSPSTVRYPG